MNSDSLLMILNQTKLTKDNPALYQFLSQLLLVTKNIPDPNSLTLNSGATGSKGIQGLQGIPGIDGIDGEQGFPGQSGAPGIAGSQGIQGIPGLMGVMGIDGEDGNDGFPGLQGLQGLQGIAGSQGINGIGIDGIDGDDSFAINQINSITSTRTIGITIDGGGSVITTGVKGFILIPVACTIKRATLLSVDAASLTGSIVIDIWKIAFARYPPTVTNTITASAKPTLSSAKTSQDSTLTGWTLSINANDVLGFNVDSVTTVTRVLFQLEVTVP